MIAALLLALAFPQEGGDIDGLLPSAHRAFDMGDYEAAANRFRRFFETWPDADRPGGDRLRLAVSLVRLRRFAEARAELELMLRRFPEEAVVRGRRELWIARNEAWIELGACHEAEGKWAEALEIYRDRVGSTPPNSAGCGLYGNELQAKWTLRVAHCLIRLNRMEELYDLCWPLVFRGLGLSTQVMICFADAAAALDRLPIVARECGRPEGGNLRRSFFGRYVRALRCWAARDFDGVMNLVEEESRSRGLKLPDPNHPPETPAAVTFASAILDLAGDFGDEIIEPLLARIERDPHHAAAPRHVIAAVRSARSRGIVRGWADAEVLRTQERPRRLLPFRRENLSERSLVNSIRITDDPSYQPAEAASLAPVVPALGVGAALLVFFELRRKKRIVRAGASG